MEINAFSYSEDDLHEHQVNFNRFYSKSSREKRINFEKYLQKNSFDDSDENVDGKYSINTFHTAIPIALDDNLSIIKKIDELQSLLENSRQERKKQIVKPLWHGIDFFC